MPRRLKALLLVLLLAGCAGSSLFQPYPNRIAAVQAQIQRGNGDAALASLANHVDDGDGLLYAQEAGRIAALLGDTPASLDYYRQAMADYDQLDWRAIVSFTDISQQLGAATVSENLLAYRGQAFERVMLHQQQALNYLWQSDLEAALVEVRRADQAQILAQKTYRENLKSQRAISNASIDAELTRLDRQAGNAPDSFINPYVLFSNAVIYEAAGQPNDALIDLRKALQLRPENTLLQREVVRLACQLNIDCDTLERQFGAPIPAPSQSGRLVILYETGTLPPRQQITIPFSWDSYYQQIALPTYRGIQAPPSLLTVQLDADILTTEPLADLDQMAARSLREQYPFILLRQGIRLATKHNANAWAERKGGDFGAISMQIFNALTEQADRRSWLTLPRQAQAATRHLHPGDYRLTAAGLQTEVAIAPGRTTLVWIAEQAGTRQIQTILI
ncbi:hypothetical protein [Ferrimonas gelatinilytica]|uniref:Tetratricopeptide repeat protein n=1 Tax=Ferrimonas gelatinilytica TaxID=1255257 RepID=A0ABP9RU54_9GAMM